MNCDNNNNITEQNVVETQNTNNNSNKDSLSLGDFFINPKPYDHIAFEYLLETALMCYISHPKKVFTILYPYL